MSRLRIVNFPSAAEQARHLAADVAGGLFAALTLRGKASLVVSGGKSPVPFFEALSEANLDWSRVSVTLADERWVPVDGPDSNERLVRTHLIRGRAATARFVGMKIAAPSALAAVTLAWEEVADVAHNADELVLGMGEDGHTASLFPGMPGIHAAMDRIARPGIVAALAPTAPRERLSLNLAALVSARNIRLAIAGAAKRKLLDDILAAPDAERWPVSAILTQTRAPVSVYRAN